MKFFVVNLLTISRSYYVSFPLPKLAGDTLHNPLQSLEVYSVSLLQLFITWPVRQWAMHVVSMWVTSSCQCGIKENPNIV